MSARILSLAACLALFLGLWASPAPAQDDVFARGLAADEARDRVRAYALFEQGCAAGDQRACDMQGYYLANGHGVEKDADRALDLTLAACEAGVDKGCLHAGFQFYAGEERPRDYDRAFELFTRGCRDGQGYESACNNLGVMYEHGQGRPADLARGAAYFEMACEMGSGIGCDNRGDLWREGNMGEADPERALTWYRRGCELDHGAACLSAGLAFSRGEGVETDAAQALGFYERGCELDNRVACYNAGLGYEGGRGASEDHAAALTRYQTACALEHANACFRGGALIDDAETDQAYLAAHRLFARGCELGATEGCYQQAWDLREGRGTTADPARATALFDQACAADFLRACNEAGLAHFRGHGVPVDGPRAVSLFEKACEPEDEARLPSPQACNNLGTLYYGGAPQVEKDLPRARAYYETACAMGLPAACRPLALFLRDGMGGEAAPELSDWLYAQLCARGFHEGAGCDAGSPRHAIYAAFVEEDYLRTQRLAARLCDDGDAFACRLAIFARLKATE